MHTHTHTRIAALTIASLILVSVSVAQGAPTQVNVRIEGKSETLFEGPILTEGHEVEASSDTRERSCDGPQGNGEGSVMPAATPTAASVDAMGIIGETFDGQWDSEYQDYFITRWGPDAQSLTEGAYWGVLVNNVFTSVGGCQYELSDGDEVLWVYNAFEHRPFLALYPAGDTAGARPLTAMAQLGRPFEVEVVAYGDDQEGVPPAGPERVDSTPYEGAAVSPVPSTRSGFEKVETKSPATVVTNAQGNATLVFDEPGWHRIKATAVGAGGEEGAIRSNRLDVCVPPEGKAGCGEPPAEDEVRKPAYLAGGGRASEGEDGETEGKREGASPGPEGKPESTNEGKSGPAPEAQSEPAPEAKSQAPSQIAGAVNTPGAGSAAAFTAAMTGLGQVRVQTPSLDGLGAARGLIGVSWQVLEAGVGIDSWTISSETLGRRDAGYVARASGTASDTSITSALLALPPGASYELEMTISDRLGRTSKAMIGKALVPYDDRWSGLRYRGQWLHMTLPGAWLGTVSRAGAGAQVSALLAAGRPVFQLRRTSGAARVEVRAGSRRELFAIAGGSAGATQLLTAAERSRAGRVVLRVLKGTVDVDGVALEP